MTASEAASIVPQLQAAAVLYVMRVLGALCILFLGRIAARMLHLLVARSLRRVSADPTVVSFTANIAYWGVWAFAIVATLSQFGVQTTSFVAVLGAVGFAVGLALQGSLANFAAGVMILLFRPFRVGERIEAAGVIGVVREIEIFATILRTDDGVKVIIPNGRLYSDVIRNHSAFKS